jgi:hypothetical protein
MPEYSPYETKVRRESARRLGPKVKIRRFRDRRDVEGLPDLRENRRRYQQYMRKGPEFAQHAQYMVNRYVEQVREVAVNRVIKETELALQSVRKRAEKQVGRPIPVSMAERQYVRELQMYVVGQMQNNVTKWGIDLKAAMASPETLWKSMIDNEHEVRKELTKAVQDLITYTSKDYITWLSTCIRSS